MRLEPVGQIVEAGGEVDGSGVDSGDVGDFVGDGVPSAVEFFSGGVARRFDGVAVHDEGIEVDHLGVRVQGRQHGFAGDAGGEGCHGGEVGAFGHGCRGGICTE